jgi:transposase
MECWYAYGMKPLTISDAESVVLGLQDEIRRSDESRYDHRLHGVLLVAQGMSCRQVSELLGDAPRTVAYWVRRFEHDGLSGLTEEEKAGRPRRLSEEQIRSIDSALRMRPADFGLAGNLWDGKTLSAFVKKQLAVVLGARQCQRLFRQLGFRLRKPRPLIAHADLDEQAQVKKTPPIGKKRRG